MSSEEYTRRKRLILGVVMCILLASMSALVSQMITIEILVLFLRFLLICIASIILMISVLQYRFGNEWYQYIRMRGLHLRIEPWQTALIVIGMVWLLRKNIMDSGFKALSRPLAYFALIVAVFLLFYILLKVGRIK